MSVVSPRISIITPVLNAEATLGEMLESVRLQGLSGIEHLLIDAESSDASLAIAARYPHLTVVSEHDRGIYDGMNKGARLATGEWLLFLQSDDWLPEGALEAFRQGVQNHPSADLICGGAEAVKKTGDRWERVWSVTDAERKHLTLEHIALGEPMINARLIRRESFLKLGGFDLEYSLASDRDFLLRAAEGKLQQEEIAATTYRYRWHPGSSTMTEGNALTNRLSAENLAIAQKHLSQVGGERQRVLKQWHTVLTVQAAMNALEAPGMKRLCPVMSQGCAVDILWPLRFVAEVTRSLPGFLLRGGKTRSDLLREKKES